MAINKVFDLIDFGRPSRICLNILAKTNDHTLEAFCVFLCALINPKLAIILASFA